jgi:CheY-like chemotaxis protein/Tfp pilus assembly protein PilZ
MIRRMQRSRSPRQPRVVVRCQVEYEHLDRLVTAESEDLSRRGVFVRTEHLLPVGAVTEIEVGLPDTSRFRVFARVAHLISPSAARAIGRHVGMGFEFLDADGGADALAAYLDDLIDDLTPPPMTIPDCLRLVLVEPSAPLRHRMVAALSSAGFTVEVCADGASALVACIANPPDGIITAMTMPDLDGNRLLRELAIHPRSAAIPVVIVSDDQSDMTRLEAYQLGVRDYIARPFLDDELLIRVRRAVVIPVANAVDGVMLRGELVEISLPTLLSLFEFERKSGVLAVTDGNQAARLFLSSGRVVKVDLERSTGSAIERLMAILNWSRGSFEFSSCEVVGTDEVGMATTQVLLEHARTEDEARVAATGS